MTALSRFEAENAIQGARNEIEYQKLMTELVEKYGAEGVAKVDRNIEREWRKENGQA